MNTRFSKIVLQTFLIVAQLGLTAQACAGSVLLPSREHTVTVQGLERSYRVYSPRPRPGSRSLPLVIVLHGTWGSGAKMERGLGFDPYAEERGFVVAYSDAYKPAGDFRSWRWNDGRGVMESANRKVDDVAFLRALVDRMAAQYGIDRRRVFVTGASNGGIMAYRVGCEAADLVNAIAPVIGNLASSLEGQCRPSRPLSLLSINGVADPFVPLHGGEVTPGVPRFLSEGGFVAGRAVSIESFRRQADCRLLPVSAVFAPKVNDGTYLEKKIYQQCRPGTEVSSILVHGGGHAWPPVMPRGDSSGVSSKNLDATREIVDFFLRQPPR